jgi:3-oxoadipate enol-lactonase
MEADMLTRARGLEFSYVAHGKGPTLVLLHAFPLSKAMWEPQIRALADDCHVVAIDLRGFGASQVTDGVFSLDDMADDVHAVITKLGHDQIVLGGLSMGGYIAFAYMRRHPATVRGLVLADTRPGVDTPEALEKRQAMIKDVLANGTRAVARSFPRAAVSTATAEGHPELLERMRVWIQDTAPTSIAGAQRALATRADSTATLSAIRVPTLVIVGEEDAITPPSEAEAMAAAIPGAQLVRIPGAGHLANLEQPEAFNAAVRTFMRQFTP